MDTNVSNDEMFIAIQAIVSQGFMFMMLMYHYYRSRIQGRRAIHDRRLVRYSLKSKIPKQIEQIRGLVQLSDETCVNYLRMNRAAFFKLCYLVEHVGGLNSTKNTSIAQQLAMFLFVISHHVKNRIILDKFKKSAETVSRHVNSVLKAVLKLHPLLLVKPQPVDDTCTDDRWKNFKDCLGALDGTYIDVIVAYVEKPRYRTRKGNVVVNMLGVCDRNMNFVYVLTGWEGSATDGRVLRDAVCRQKGLKVPLGQYYLCDGRYTNGQGFLAPYSKTRYHLKEWDEGGHRPENYKEYFNMKHARARNIIEKGFGALKTRWAILRSNSWYPIDTHNRMILACVLLHNYIRREMVIDPIEHLLEENAEDTTQEPSINYVESVGPSQAWTNWRDELANSMWNDYRNCRC